MEIRDMKLMGSWSAMERSDDHLENNPMANFVELKYVDLNMQIVNPFAYLNDL